ncbi:hypothetical protein ONN26_26255, partial [Salmonella enterica subsp. enterica serovar Muenster]|nr:hypothetical protein [Salmonella enterica subsp. enterica serovar Muenster]
FAPRLTGKGPFTDVYSVMANWGANHGVLTIGHVGADFITLAAPVCQQRNKLASGVALNRLDQGMGAFRTRRGSAGRVDNHK